MIRFALNFKNGADLVSVVRGLAFDSDVLLVTNTCPFFVNITCSPSDFAGA